MTLSLAMPGTLTGAVLAFATSLDEVVLMLFVAGPNQRTLARQMFSTIRDNINPAIAAAALLFIFGTLLLAAVVLTIWRNKEAAPIESRSPPHESSVVRSHRSENAHCSFRPQV